MSKFRVQWEGGFEDIEAADEGAAMEEALDFVVMTAEEIEADEEEDEKGE